MKVIFKYGLDLVNLQELLMPKGWSFLAARYEQPQLIPLGELPTTSALIGRIRFWALVDPSEEEELTRFAVVPTGTEVPQGGHYEATVFNDDMGLVWHVYTLGKVVA